MATTCGQESPAIDDSPSVVSESLQARPWPLGFFQTVRLLQLMGRDKKPIGQFAKPADEAVRLAAHTGFAFPASEVQSIEQEADGAGRVRVNIMGLTGPSGVLPLVYTALLRERVRTRDYAARDFLDIFHHRLLSLFYRAWERYQFGVVWERGERDGLSQHLADLIGLGATGLQNRQAVPDAALLFYAGLLGMGTRPAIALEQILSDYFAVPVEIEQFVGAWHPIDRASQCCLGEANGSSVQLGRGALAGRSIWEEQSRLRVRLGPLTIQQYRELLPGGEANERLRSLVGFYVGMQFDMEAELILRRDDVPPCELNAGPGAGVQLGWTTWVKTGAFGRDPGDTILELEQAA